jgi:fatty-acyl-CoA synthase
MVAFKPSLALELIEAEHATTFAGVPTMFIAMAEHPDFDRRDLSTLKAVGSGGAPLASSVLHRLESNLGVPCINVFGQTEGLVATMTTPCDTFDRRANTVGRPLPHIEVRIVDPEARTLEAGQVGEVCVRSFSVMLGYDKLPEATAEAIDPNRWLHTGDLGNLDEFGYLRIEGRLRDMVIRGGENIYPAEVEAVLVSHPSVGDAAVVGVPDERWGEQLVAFIRPAPDCAPQVDELAELVRGKLAHFKVPAYWEVLDEYPMTSSGKVKKVELRQRWIKAQQAGKRRSESRARRQGE